MAKNIIIMGVAGCGKTSVGEALSAATGIEFIDGDALHPASNVAKMSSGTPLTDEDRWPWLAAVGAAFAANTSPLIIGCSALKKIYRDHIRHHAGSEVTFIHLGGSRQVIEQRMKSRKGHFMPLALLDSQFATLEIPSSSENATTIDIDQSLDDIVGAAIKQLKLSGAH